MKSFKEEKCEIYLWGEEIKEPVPVIWCHIFSREEGEKIWQQITRPCVLAGVSGRDWNGDFLPGRQRRLLQRARILQAEPGNICGILSRSFFPGRNRILRLK